MMNNMPEVDNFASLKPYLPPGTVLVDCRTTTIQEDVARQVAAEHEKFVIDPDIQKILQDQQLENDFPFVPAK